ncbi:MAG: HEAT repeat domain-containing protein, partial [Planctomycetota bacterium]
RAFAGRLVEALLADEDASLRVLACRRVEALPGEGDERLGKVLPLLRDPMSDVRAAAAEALVTLANPRASWGLARALARESDPYAQARMLAALEASEPEATLNLILRLQRRKDVDDQRGAALALRAFSGEATLGGLQRALGSAEPAVVEAALESALALIERDGAEPWTPCRAAVEAVDPAGPQGELRSQTLNALDRAG